MSNNLNFCIEISRLRCRNYDLASRVDLAVSRFDHVTNTLSHLKIRQECYTIRSFSGRKVLGRKMFWLMLVFVGFIFSLVTNNAVGTIGVRSTFLILGGLHLGVCALAIPLYIFGKRARAWTYRKGFMDWLYDD